MAGAMRRASSSRASNSCSRGQGSLILLLLVPATALLAGCSARQAQQVMCARLRAQGIPHRVEVDGRRILLRLAPVRPEYLRLPVVEGQPYGGHEPTLAGSSRAKGRPLQRDGDNSRDRPRFYAVNREDRRVYFPQKRDGTDDFRADPGTDTKAVALQAGRPTP